MLLSTLSDDTLASQARSGCGHALTELYRRHAPTLLRYLNRIAPNADEAEDALQDTFIRLIEARGSYEGRGRFRSWLFTVASRLVSDRRRQHSRRSALIDQHAESLAPAPDPGPAGDDEPAWETARIIAITEQVLADLPEAYAQTFILRVRENFSYREIADILGDPEGTLRSRVHHTLRRVRVVIAHELPSQPQSGDETVAPSLSSNPERRHA